MSLFQISAVDLAAAYRALAALYNSGIGPSKAFSFMEESTRSLPLKNAMNRLSARTADGTAVSVAMTEFPNIFPPLHRTIFAAAEASGMMAGALTTLAEIVEQDFALKESVRKDVLPIKINLVFVFLLVILVTALGIWHWDALPMWARLMLSGFTVIGCIAFTAATLLVQVNNEAEERYGEKVKKVPLIGKLSIMISESHFTHVLAACHAAGMQPFQSIGLAADACGSNSMKAKLLGAIPMVRDGKTMAESLQRMDCLSNFVISTVRVGEESGKVSEVLMRSQKQQNSLIAEYTHTTKTYVSLLANIAVWGLGGTVVAICYLVFGMSEML
jgi:type II secretory pathway component PulF